MAPQTTPTAQRDADETRTDKSRAYRLTLTTEDGEVLDVWTVGGPDGLDLSKPMAASALAHDIREQCELAEAMDRHDPPL